MVARCCPLTRRYGTKAREFILDNLLFKYRDISKYTLEIFLNKQIYLPVSSQFNDPFDAQLLPSSFMQELRKLGATPSRDDFDLHESYVKERLKNYGIYSLSRKPNDILMWSHYAQSHTGICIGFNEDITHYFCGYDWPIWVMEVLYESEHPFKKILEDLQSKSRFNSVNVFANHCMLGQALLEAALTIKHESWKYENEVRVISEMNGFQSFKSAAIDCVILGMGISKSDEFTLRSILSAPEWSHVKIYRAVRSEAALALKLIEANVP
ncbi:hypothetical protein CGI39_24055 [Vibrio parahaemolyticus]|nr:hypothetical protein CGI69_21360 [Vibrio parahaemolyticus]TOJ33730.1 hypothetical protein CGI40_24030 [Vibrio parahaemolyticus]TOJ38419.1 hypothetical protein CGI39_24055 [Vibrio parahaemolyticus]TOJ60784.1 hypothetical protein CGI36_21580 [Vibrio parahaemolyticus]